MNTSLFRDVECGMDVSRMVELGKFDKEFTVYGLAYRQEEKTYFAISEHADTIYRLHKKLQLQGLVPTNIMSHYVATSVPAGSLDDIWQDVKWELASRLRKNYTDDFLNLLNHLGSRPANNVAWPYLKHCQEALEGRFLKDWLQLFDSLLIECYLAKQLDTEHFQSLNDWSQNVWRQMEDDAVIMDIHSRTLNGFAYLIDEKMHYKINAQYVHVCEQRQKLLNQGYIVTPIYSETYWFQTQSQFPAKRCEYEKKLSTMLTTCMKMMRILREKTAFMDRDDFLKNYDIINKNNTLEIETLKNYGYQWNCL
ncbi:MAG: hypothetical protein UDB11_11370 [Peptococcaceae bacterium]|nr:hypothetical protein [Peptococcaceae bacterium]